ncbi:MAG: asparagine synthase C-terminal domain-containing protein [Candidatus Woesearchaeota archaeon]
MQELWSKEDRLITEEEWIKTISNLKKKDTIKNLSEAKKQLKDILTDSVKKRVPQDKKIGVFFSGGVDSSFIAAVCKELSADFTCYTVGFQEGTKEPEDILEAKKVAQKLGFKLKYKLFNLKETETIIKKTIKTLKPVHKTDVVNIGVGAVILAAAELARKDKINHLLGGLGSEEIFAGYQRHQVKDINQECWRGLKAMWSRDLVRDFTLSQSLNITINTPFLDEELIAYAMTLPGHWKINPEGNKMILREIAEEFLGTFAWRKKKAAQYGSCFDKAISKLAKQQGFKFKKDYLDSL